MNLIICNIKDCNVDIEKVAVFRSYYHNNLQI